MADEFEEVLAALIRTQTAMQQRAALAEQVKRGKAGETVTAELTDDREVWDAVEAYNKARFEILEDLMETQGISWCSGNASAQGHVVTEEPTLVYLSGEVTGTKLDHSYSEAPYTRTVSEARHLCQGHMLHSAREGVTARIVVGKHIDGTPLYTADGEAVTPSWRYDLCWENIPDELIRRFSLPPLIEASRFNGGADVGITLKPLGRQISLDDGRISITAEDLEEIGYTA